MVLVAVFIIITTVAATVVATVAARSSRVFGVIIQVVLSRFLADANCMRVIGVAWWHVADGLLVTTATTATILRKQHCRYRHHDHQGCH